MSTHISLSKPADLNLKHIPDENPYELSPVIGPGDVEMKNHMKFTQLPQDPPEPVPRPRTMETDLTSGVSVEHPLGSPSYKNPPPYRGHSGHGQHFYEEVHHKRGGGGGVQHQMSKDEYGSPASLNQSHSHTEADQAILFSQSTTNSLAPLTVTDTVERRPRKKVNPLYDSYREENGQPEGQSNLSLPVKDNDMSKPNGPVGCIGSALRHPCTTIFIFLLLVGLVVLFVLLIMGTISSKGGSTAAVTQPSNSTEMERLRQQVTDQENLISQMMSQIRLLEMAISTPSNENASVNARIAYNTLQIMSLQQNMTTLDNSITGISTKADLAFDQSSQNIGTLAAYKNRIETLESNSRRLNTSVNTLTGNLQTHSIDINRINEKNQQQDNELTRVDSRINVVGQDFEMRLEQYNDTIFQELATISKMQGPRGYNGSDGADGTDLSACRHMMSNTGSGTGTAVTTTSEIMAGQNEVITGATCSTVGGERAFLTVSGNQGSEKYQCSCSGVSAGSSIRYCYIYYWKCPVA